MWIGSSTLPRATTRATETDTRSATAGATTGDKVAAATSSTSLYDNVSGTTLATPAAGHPPPPKGDKTILQTIRSCYFISSQL